MPKTIIIIKNMNIEIPGELITKNTNAIDYSPLQGKILVGCLGMAKSGKDTLGKLMVKRLGFKRIAFADTLKNDLNEYMKVPVYNDLVSRDVNIELEDIDFFKPPTAEIKEILRPYIIWFGETMKKINGVHHWTNRALAQIEPSDKKIVITDVRRENELEIFKGNREFIETRRNNRINVGIEDEEEFESDFESILIHVNQYGLKDQDQLTIQTILNAQEEWLIDDVVFVDSRIKDEDDYREQHMMIHLKNLVKKHPQYFI